MGKIGLVSGEFLRHSALDMGLIKELIAAIKMTRQSRGMASLQVAMVRVRGRQTILRLSLYRGQNGKVGNALSGHRDGCCGLLGCTHVRAYGERDFFTAFFKDNDGSSASAIFDALD